MKKLLYLVCVGSLLCACSSKKGNEGKYPADFNKIGDAGRVGRMMKTASPDSVARWIINGALGREEGTHIDTLAIATSYAFEHYKDNELEQFSVEYDNYVESLPIADKMMVYKLGGSEDPQKLGYKLGLEYMSVIRDEHLSVDQVEKELQEFKKACGTDTTTYRRFLIGFKTVLEVDHGKDVPEEIYKRFCNVEY